MSDPEALLAEAEVTLQAWADEAERAWRQGRDIAEALGQAFAADLETVDTAYREKLETLNGVHSNAAGLRRWLESRAGPDRQP
jgi:hypothetical protein